MPLAQLTSLTSPLAADQIEQLQKLSQSMTPEQLVWVSGYLAGVGQIPLGSSLQSTTDSNDKLTILYGSQTGNARSVAEQFAALASEQGVANELVSMADLKPKQFKNLTHVVVLVSTHGEGEAPDDAEELHQFLASKKAPKLEHLHYAVLAFGDSSYEFFCQTGKDFAQRLQALGAKAMTDMVELDVDYEDDVSAWQDKLLEVATPLLSVKNDNVVAMPGVALASSTTTYTRKNPYMASVLANQKITGRDSVKDIRHLEFDLADSGIQYQPGDSLGIWFKNDTALVKDLLGLIGVDAGVDVTVGEQTMSVEQALIEEYELTLLHPGFVQKYAQAIQSEALIALSEDKEKLRDYVETRQVIDVVAEYPASLTADDFIACLRRLTPRMYSIASSMADVEDEVHLTVAAVRYNTHDRDHAGGASGFLADRIKEGDEVDIFVESNNNFKLPTNADTPVIMIGPGTGIAPFRAFVQEREATQASGKNWLFFGNPHSTQDFLYQTEWQRYLADGVLTDIDLAFSRDQAQKVYVQHRLLERGEKVWEWLQQGAYLYVCGDATYMAKDVHQALLHIVQQYGQKSTEQAEEFLTQLRREKRYQKDVY